MNFNEFIAPWEEELEKLDPVTGLNYILGCIAEADRNGNASIRIQARVRVMQVARDVRRPDVMITLYPSMLAILDETDIEANRGRILWYYKWVLSDIVNFVQIPRNQIETMLDEFERLYLAEGAPSCCVHLIRRLVYRNMTDVDNVLRQNSILETLHFPWGYHLLDDQENVTHWDGDAQSFAGRYEQAFRILKPVADGRKITDQRILTDIWATLLWPAWKLNRIEEGDRYFDSVMHTLEGFPLDSEYASEVLLYAALRGRTEEAKSLLQTWIPRVLSEVHQRFALDMYAAAVPALRLLRKQGQYAIRLHITELHPGFPEALRGEYNTEELISWCEKTSRTFAMLYDDRNGNEYLTKKVQERVVL